MTLRRAVLGFFAISLIYLLGLIWADSRGPTFALLPDVLQVLPTLVGLAFLSWMIRYVRWHWLLVRAGYRTGWAFGYAAYLSGFAFTATPGKVGELVRIRYLQRKSIPSSVVFGAFVYERWFDLIVVFLLGAAAFGQAGLLLLSAAFIALFSLALVFFISFPQVLLFFESMFVKRRFNRLGAMVRVVKDGIAACRTWMHLLDVLVAFCLGLLAWSVTAFSFFYLLGWLGVEIPPLSAFGSYPLAMLVGAASMLPGGIGSTELSLVAVLGFYGVPIAVGTVAAITIRLAGMWFAIVFGFAAMLILELTNKGQGVNGQ